MTTWEVVALVAAGILGGVVTGVGLIMHLAREFSPFR